MGVQAVSLTNFEYLHPSWIHSFFFMVLVLRPRGMRNTLRAALALFLGQKARELLVNFKWNLKLMNY